jgi:hypothetical protein
LRRGSSRLTVAEKKVDAGTDADLQPDARLAEPGGG